MGAASDTDGRPAYRPSSLDAVLEDVVTPAGPYRLRLMARSGTWRGTLPGNRLAAAHQRPDGRVVVRAPDEEALANARFMAQLAYGFEQRPDARYGLTALCIGLGMGAAVLWENTRRG